LVGQVSGNLAARSGRRKGTGEAEEQNVLARKAAVQRDPLGRKAVVQGQVGGDRVADVDGAYASKGGEQCHDGRSNLHGDE
jgi:hypothetical protein